MGYKHLVAKLRHWHPLHHSRMPEDPGLGYDLPDAPSPASKLKLNLQLPRVTIYIDADTHCLHPNKLSMDCATMQLPWARLYVIASISDLVTAWISLSSPIYSSDPTVLY